MIQATLAGIGRDDGNGAVIAYPDGISPPNTSNLNYTAGQTVPNLAIVPVGADGYVDLAKLGPGSVDMIADVEGFFTQTAAAGYTSETPARILDTRTATGAFVPTAFMAAASRSSPCVSA